MDRAQYVKKLEELMVSERETLQTCAVAQVAYLAEGKFQEASWALQEATLAYWRITVMQMEAKSGRMWDSSYEGLAEDVQSGRGFESWFAFVKKTWAERAFREFQAAWRMFAQEGVRIGPHLMEKLYALDPTERERKIRGFSPTVSDVKDVATPCVHDLAPVILEEQTFGRVKAVRVICTECCQRFVAVSGPTAAIVTRSDLQIARPYVQD